MYMITVCSVPSGHPQNIEARAVSSRMSTLSWDLPNYEDRNGIIIGYVNNVKNTRRSEICSTHPIQLL